MGISGTGGVGGIGVGTIVGNGIGSLGFRGVGEGLGVSVGDGDTVATGVGVATGDAVNGPLSLETLAAITPDIKTMPIAKVSAVFFNIKASWVINLNK